ncbi:MAG: DUF3006 domain-containing protein [Bacilli bacterium]|nr:DUF3006 domain-containing protein [Bacilli bacterium]
MIKYIVDRFEEDIVVLEKNSTNEMIEIDKSILSDNIHEGSVIIYDGNKYYLDNEDEKKRRKDILEKFMRLKSIEDE